MFGRIPQYSHLGFLCGQILNHRFLEYIRTVQVIHVLRFAASNLPLILWSMCGFLSGCSSFLCGVSPSLTTSGAQL